MQTLHLVQLWRKVFGVFDSSNTSYCKKAPKHFWPTISQYPNNTDLVSSCSAVWSKISGSKTCLRENLKRMQPNLRRSDLQVPSKFLLLRQLASKTSQTIQRTESRLQTTPTLVWTQYVRVYSTPFLHPADKTSARGSLCRHTCWQSRL